MREVAAHQLARPGAELGAACVIEVGHLLQPAEAHRGGERRDDQPAAEPRRKLDRRLGERRDIGRQGLLHRLGRDAHVVELVVLAVMRDAAVRGPQRAHQLHALLEDALIVGEIDLEGQILARVVAAPGREIDAPVREQVERRPLLGDADRMMQRQHGDGRREADVLGARRDIGQHQIGAGEHAERVEVMLADPGRVHAELVGIERLVGDVGDELVGVTRVVFVVVIAEREVAEVHVLLPCWLLPLSLPAFSRYVERPEC